MEKPTEDELLILNCIIYTPQFATISAEDIESDFTIFDWVNTIKLDKIPDSAEYGGMDKEEITNIINTIKSNPDVYGNMIIKDVDNKQYANVSGTQRVTNATISYDDSFIVVYKGTGGDYEWRDNGEGGYSNITDTDQQLAALHYFDWAQKEFNFEDKVYVTGHSKGGNKAQYVTILRGDLITQTLSFDGPGFGLPFCEKYKDLINRYRDKITSISNENDYVNILFRSIVNADKNIYIQSNSKFEIKKSNWKEILFALINPSLFKMYKNAEASIYQLGYCHSPYTMFKNNSGILSLDNIVEQSDLLKELEAFVDYCQLYMEEEDWRFLCFSIMSLVMDGENVIGNGDYSKEPDEFFVRLITHITTYASKNKGKDIIGIAITAPNGYSQIIRDFTEGTKQAILEIVNTVEEEPFWNIGKWAVWSHIADFTGVLDFPADGENLHEYYRSVIDKDNIGKVEIVRIFQDVYALETDFIEKLNTAKKELSRVIFYLQDMIVSLEIVILAVEAV